MTRSGVGRSQRTGSRSPFIRPPGPAAGSAVPALPAPSIQAVGRATRHVVVRWGLRSLAVAGFAGAAWLLSTNAAQAAEVPATDPITDLSVVDVLTGPDNTGPLDAVVDRIVPAVLATPASAVLATAAPSALGTPVAGALATAYQPVLGTPSALLTGAVAPAREATSAVLLQAAAAHPDLIGGSGRAGSPIRTGPAASDAAGADVARSVHGPVAAVGGADRVAGPIPPLAALTRVVPPISDPVAPVLRSVTDPLLVAAAPVVATLGPATRSWIGALRQAVERDLTSIPNVAFRLVGAAGGGTLAPAGGGGPASAGRAGPAPVGGPQAFAGTADRDRSGPFGTGTHIRSSVRSVTGAELRPAGTEAGRAGTSDGPGRPLPVPLRDCLGFGTGAPATGPGSIGGGNLAPGSTAVAGSVAHSRRLPVPADVVVARQESESPTVSPD
jgi:hypothetical protein